MLLIATNYIFILYFFKENYQSAIMSDMEIIFTKGHSHLKKEVKLVVSTDCLVYVLFCFFVCLFFFFVHILGKLFLYKWQSITEYLLILIGFFLLNYYIYA